MKVAVNTSRCCACYLAVPVVAVTALDVSHANGSSSGVSSLSLLLLLLLLVVAAENY
jgi:hypothetical protein